MDSNFEIALAEAREKIWGTSGENKEKTEEVKEEITCKAAEEAQNPQEEVGTAKEKTEEVKISEIKTEDTLVVQPDTSKEENIPKPKCIGRRFFSGLFGLIGIIGSATVIGGILFGIFSICLGKSAKKKSGKGSFAVTLGVIALILGILALAGVIYFVYCYSVNPSWTCEMFNLPSEYADMLNLNSIF